MKNFKIAIKQAFKEGPIGIYLMAFMTPLYAKFLGIITAIIILEFLVRRTKVQKSYIQSQLSWKNPGIWLLSFYLLHFVGLLYTENMRFANMDIGMKATLGIFPLLFVFYQPKINWTLFIKSFVVGALLSIVINFGISFNLYLETGSIKVFYDSRLTHLMHRGYWAVYLVIAVFFLLKEAFDNPNNKRLVINFSLALVIAVFAVLSLSKMGMVLLTMVFIWMTIKLILLLRNKWVLPLSITFFVVGVLAAYSFIPAMKPRMDAMFIEAAKPVDEYDYNRPGSTGARILVWKSSLELIKENFLIGVGTGDVKDELIQKNRENGYIGVADKELNSHNQYLNSHVALGVLAPLFLLMTFLTSFIKRKPKDPYYTWRIRIVFVLFLAMLTESMLEVEAGIIPYAFLLSFLPVIVDVKVRPNE